MAKPAYWFCDDVFVFTRTTGPVLGDEKNCPTYYSLTKILFKSEIASSRDSKRSYFILPSISFRFNSTGSRSHVLRKNYNFQFTPAKRLQPESSCSLTRTTVHSVLHITCTGLLSRPLTPLNFFFSSHISISFSHCNCLRIIFNAITFHIRIYGQRKSTKTFTR